VSAMRIDDLREELHAMDTGPEPDLGAGRARVEARVRRSRARRAGLSALALVLVASLAGYAVAHNRGNRVGIATVDQPKLVPLDRVDSPDAVVKMPRDATLAQLQRVEDGLASDPAVNGYARFPLYGSCVPGQGWVVDLTSPEPRAVAALDRVLPATATTVGWPDRGEGFSLGAVGERALFDIEIYMNPSATSAQITAVRDRLRAAPSVLSFTYLTHRDAYNEFKRIEQGNPSLVDNIHPSDLPASFRVRLRRGTDRAVFLRPFNAFPGVYTSVERAAAFNRVVPLTAAPSVTGCTPQP
jgi:FtsX extracellular domain